MAGLIEDGWSLVIYPEGGRSPDGWGQTFKGGAAYLAGRTGAPVVPVYIDGTDSIMGKGTSVPKPGRTRVTFGSPLRRQPDESTRRFNERIERAVAALADESTTDYWSARRRAAAGHDAVAHRPGVHRLAAPLGPRQPPPARHRRLAQPAEAPLARPRLTRAPSHGVAGCLSPSSAARHEDVGADDEGAVARRVGVRLVELVDGDVEALGDAGRDVARLDRVGALPRPSAHRGGSSGSTSSSLRLVSALRPPSRRPRRPRRPPRPPRRRDRAPGLLAGC